MLEVLVGLTLEGITACGLERTPTDVPKLRASWQAVLGHPDHWVRLLLDHNGYAHGFLVDNWHLTAPSAYLAHLYVREGQRSPALFKGLVDDFADWAARKGADCAVACLVNGQAGPAVDRLWRRVGFGPPVGSIYERWL